MFTEFSNIGNRIIVSYFCIDHQSAAVLHITQNSSRNFYEKTTVLFLEKAENRGLLPVTGRRIALTLMYNSKNIAVIPCVII